MCHPMLATALALAASSALAQAQPVIALDSPTDPGGAQRHHGLLKGFGLAATDAKRIDLGKADEVVCTADNFGDGMKALGAGMIAASSQPCPLSMGDTVAVMTGAMPADQIHADCLA